MKTCQDIQEVLLANKSVLSSKYPIKDLAIFGSFARNEQNELSDLDLLVEFNGSIGIQFIDLANELESLIGHKIDLVSKNGIKPKYYESIKKDLIYV